MRVFTRRLTVLAAVLPLSLTSAADARQGGEAAWVRQSAAHESLLDFDYPGGRLNEFYDGLTRRLIESDQRLNVIVSPQAKFIEMPAFSARAMPPVDAIRMPAMLLSGVGVTNTSRVAVGEDGDSLPGALTFVVSVDMSKAYTAPPLESEERVSIDFPGGTLEAYIERVRERAPGLNIVVEPEAAGAEVGPVRLRDAPASEALWMLHDRPAGAGQIEIVERRGGLFVVKVAKQPEQTRIWSLAEHLNSGMNADDLLAGVEAAVGAVGEGGAIRFHPPTAMLIVRARPDQVSAADQAVRHMLEAGARQEDDERHLRARIRATEEKMPQLIRQMRIAAKQVEVAQVHLDEVMDAMEEELAPRSAVAEAELDVVRAQAELEKIQTEIKRIEAWIADAKQRLDD